MRTGLVFILHSGDKINMKPAMDWANNNWRNRYGHRAQNVFIEWHSIVQGIKRSNLLSLSSFARFLSRVEKWMLDVCVSISVDWSWQTTCQTPGHGDQARKQAYISRPSWWLEIESNQLRKRWQLNWMPAPLKMRCQTEWELEMDIYFRLLSKYLSSLVSGFYEILTRCCGWRQM